MQSGQASGCGIVSLVGAGPGDPGLMTLKGAQRLREADCVYYDALVAPELLAWCRPGARLVPVGKRRGAPSVGQEEIEAALVRDARAGLAVVRLKGGDPFVFGRGGEEALALLREGIGFEVVPGVTSGTAVPALAGIPLTHRGLSSSAAFITAHDLAGEGAGKAVRERLRHLARGADTLVVFMAGAEMSRVRFALLEAGLDAATPAALIVSGTTADERAAIGTLGGLETLRGRLGIAVGPVLLVVGRTVALASDLKAGEGTDLWDGLGSGRQVEQGSGTAGRRRAPAQTGIEAEPIDAGGCAADAAALAVAPQPTESNNQRAAREARAVSRDARSRAARDARAART